MAGTLAYTQAGVNTNELLLGASLVLRGAGLGAVTIPVMAGAYLGLRSDQVAHASIATRITSQLGGAFGAAVFALILQTQLAAQAAGGLVGRATTGSRRSPRGAGSGGRYWAYNLNAMSSWKSGREMVTVLPWRVTEAELRIFVPVLVS